VLANEQVVDGRCERCGTEVEARQLEQWFFRITDYADRLIEGPRRDRLAEHVKTMQRNWIGRSEGAEVTFRCDELADRLPRLHDAPDTLFGATFFVMAPEHPDVERLAAGTENEQAVREYVNHAIAEAMRSAATRARRRRVSSSPLRDKPRQRRADADVRRRLRADGVRDGAIMAVPAHDERDHAFAVAYDLPIRS